MTTLKDYIRDDVVEFLKDYDSDELNSQGIEAVADRAEELVEEIMDTISEKVLGLLR